MEHNERDEQEKKLPLLPSHQGNELPLVVWLKGDEPFFDEFYLDADDAMAFLDIKRTRLSQISGREIRVGRVKSGRYVKPKYRKIDLESYLNHSRAPTTHQKAALLSAKIDSTLGEWDERFNDQVETLKTEIHRSLSQVVVTESSNAKESLTTLLKMIQHKLSGEVVKSREDLRLWMQKYFILGEREILDLKQEMHVLLTRQNSLETNMLLVSEIYNIDQELQTRFKAFEKKFAKDLEFILKQLSTLETSMEKKPQRRPRPELLDPAYQGHLMRKNRLPSQRRNLAQTRSLRPNPPRNSPYF